MAAWFKDNPADNPRVNDTELKLIEVEEEGGEEKVAPIHWHTVLRTPNLLPNFLIQECFDDFLEPWALDLFPGVPRVFDGYLEPPGAPGIGVGLDERETLKHPYGQNNFLRLFEDGWERRK